MIDTKTDITSDAFLMAAAADVMALEDAREDARKGFEANPGSVTHRLILDAATERMIMARIAYARSIRGALGL